MERTLIIVENNEIVKAVMNELNSKATEYKLGGNIASSTSENYYANEKNIIQVITKNDSYNHINYDEIICLKYDDLMKQKTVLLAGAAFDDILGWI